MAVDLVIRGDLVLPDRILADGYLGIRDGRIELIGSGEPPVPGPVDDLSGCLLFPGLIDAHVHAGSVGGVAGLRDTTIAAAAGGVTTIVDMPFDDPQPVDNVETLLAKIERIGELASVDVALYVTAPKNGPAGAIKEMAAAGACAVKLSTYEYHPVRFPRFTIDEMRDAFTEAAAVGLPVGFHNEDHEIVAGLTRKVREAGQCGPETHALTRPPIAEIVANAQVFELGLRTGAHTHIVHSSVVEGIEMAERYRGLGARASAETCLQYLTFNEDDVVRRGPSLKQTPPLRSEEQRLALWRALAEGRIGIVSTDHVPWPLSRKSDPDMFKNSSGVPGLETLLPIFYTGITERGLSPRIIADVCSANVARHFGFADRKGALRIGADADVAVLRPETGMFQASRMVAAEKWSPYDGMPTAGRVAATYLRGRKVFADGRMLEQTPQGAFVRPRPAG